MELRKNNICPFCKKNFNTEEHHKFIQSKWNKKVYSKKLIDSEWNKIKCCNGCNGSHSNIPKWARWDEKRFRYEAEIRGYQLPPGTKSFLNKLVGMIT